MSPRLALPLVLLAALVASFTLVASASAELSRTYTGVSFGPDGTGGTRTFANLGGIAVDQTKDFVYAYDSGDGGKVYKFDLTGKAVPFASRPGNVIEAVGGSSGSENEIAVAPPDASGETAGDIYVANNSTVKVFSEAGVELGTLGSGETCGVAVSPTTGNLLIGSYPGTLREYAPAHNPPTNADLVATGTVEVELCNVAADSANGIYATAFNGREIAKLEGVADGEPTRFEPGAPTLFADPETNILYADRGELVAIYDAAGAQVGRFATEGISGSRGVAVSDKGKKAYVGDGLGRVRVYGPTVTVPNTATGSASGVIPDGATLNGTVSPNGVPLQKCFFEYGAAGFEKTAPCSAPDASEVSPTGENVPVHATVTGLKATSSYQFRLVTGNADGSSAGGTAMLTTPGTAVTEPASVTTEGAILNGKVFPSEGKVTTCKFDYGLTSHPGFEGSSECNPAALSIPEDSEFHHVTAKLIGLKKEASYRFRLVATTIEGTTVGDVLRFETFGKPSIREPRASDADQEAVTLEATVNPRGSATTYAFEWGATASYGHVAPVESASPYGSAGLIVVKTRLSGLSSASTYHFRLVATNASGTTESGDAELETLDQCDLPDRRCFENVSERKSGPVAQPDEFAGGVELHFQAAAQAGDVAYVIESGYPDSTKGAEVVYRALRGSSEWASNQLSAPLEAQNQVSGSSAHSSRYQALSESLSCGVLNSNQPLTADASTRFAVETGGANLYRDNMNGSYTAISSIPPENPSAVRSVTFAYNVYGVSSSCEKVVFETFYRYPGVPTGGATYPLYEWNEGTLRSLNFVPGPSGEVQVEASAGASSTILNNIVSEDGSRVFFSASRQTSTNPEEIGTTGVFVREDGTLTRDLSLSDTTTPDRGAKYQSASKDGSRVFFLANAGLTTESGTEGQDLYEYNIPKEQLTDLSPDKEVGGAEVVGLAGNSYDGSRVYYVARGELVPGQGKSFDENVHDNTYSMFTERGGEIAYVGPIRATYPRITSGGFPNEENQVERDLVGPSETAQVSPDGRYLVFESSAAVTDYEGGNGIAEAYLFDADATREPTVCVSCRGDGQPTTMPRGNRFLVEARAGNSLQAPRSLAVRNGKPEVFFTAFDPLAPGAVDGRFSIYEWAHGQIYQLATEPPGYQSKEHYEGFTSVAVKALGANGDGTDIYFADPQRLTWEDEDDRYSIYDARIGGGFPQPPAPPGPCNPTAEGSCQGVAPGPSSSVPHPPTQSFHGPGNPKPRKRHRKRHKHHRHSNKRHRHADRHNGNRHHRHANSDRGHGA